MYRAASLIDLLVATMWNAGGFWRSRYSLIHGAMNSAPHRAHGAITLPSHGAIGVGACGNPMIRQHLQPSLMESLTVAARMLAMHPVHISVYTARGLQPAWQSPSVPQAVSSSVAMTLIHGGH